jgi:hypothetical protein
MWRRSNLTPDQIEDRCMEVGRLICRTRSGGKSFERYEDERWVPDQIWRLIAARYCVSNNTNYLSEKLR